MANKSLKTLDIITVLMKNDRVREFKWLDTRSWEEDRYSKQIKRDREIKWKRIRFIKPMVSEYLDVAEINALNMNAMTMK